MTPYKILMISTDKEVLTAGSPAFNRQTAYLRNFERADVLVLGVPHRARIEQGNLKMWSYGGASKLSSFLRTFSGHVRQVRAERYDVIYTQDVLYCGILGFLFALLCKGSAFVTQLHGNYVDNPLWIQQRIQNRLLNSIGKFLIRKSDYIRCVSKRIVEYVAGEMHIDRLKLVSLPIGINGDEFNAKGVSVAARGKKILFCGRLIPEKEPLFFCDIVIPILKKHAEFSAQIIGEGELQPVIAARFAAEGLEDRLEMPGLLDARSLAQCYKEGFCLVHTAFWEGWGLPMVEASACGLPVITTDTGCAGEVIIDGVNGIVCAGKDKEMFIQAVEKLIVDSKRYMDMCTRGAQLASAWTFDTLRDKTEQFLEHAANETKQ